VESKTTQKEIEAAAKQKETELNAQIEKEKAEREVQLKKLQLELNAQVRESQSNTSVDESGDHTTSHVSDIKAMKLPPFHEEKDDLDAYLNRFEKPCRAFNVPQEQWSLQLARFLQGQALEVYQRMTDEDAGHYGLLKKCRLKRFRLTERC